MKWKRIVFMCCCAVSCGNFFMGYCVGSVGNLLRVTVCRFMVICYGLLCEEYC